MANPFLIGLCAACQHVKVIKSAKGGVFVLCNLAKTNPRFNKYPLLPVLHCSGFVAQPQPNQEAE